MKIKFWGVRGSIPSPGPATVRYGGNTTCIEVRLDDDTLIILDAGTGIFPLAQSLLSEFPLSCHILNTHTHWDHIQGLPFFIPLFVPNNHIHIYGAFDPISQSGIDEILTTQLQYRFFPIREAELKSTVHYHAVTESNPLQIGDATITPIMMNHPVINFGYRIDYHGKSMFFTGDHEPPYNIYNPNDDEYLKYQNMLNEKQQQLIARVQGVDVMIADCSYTPEEYPSKRGWGHGTYDSSIQLAQEAHVGKLYCTHHEPTRSDDNLEKIFAEAMQRHPRQAQDPEYYLSQEGLEISW